MKYKKNDQMMKLKVYENTDSFFSKEFSTDNEVKIGRSEHCDLALRSQSVSRNHCRIFFFNGHWLIEDLNGHNGILVNGSNVFFDNLKGGDILQIGDFRIEIHLDRPVEVASDFSIDEEEMTILLEKNVAGEQAIVENGFISQDQDSKTSVNKIKGTLFRNPKIIVNKIKETLFRSPKISVIKIKETLFRSSEIIVNKIKGISLRSPEISVNKIKGILLRNSETILNKIKGTSLRNIPLPVITVSCFLIVLLAFIVTFLLPGEAPVELEKVVLEQEIKKSEIMLDMQSKQMLDYYLESGREQYEAGKYNEAFVQFRSAISIDPENQLALEHIDLIYDIFKQVEEQQQLTETKEKELSERVSSIVAEARQFFNQSDSEKAMEILAEAVFLSPEEPSAQDLKLQIEKSIKEQIQKKEQASKTKEQLLAQAKSYYNSGQDYYDRNEFYNALVEWKKALSLDVDSPENRHIRRTLPHIRKVMEDQVYEHYNSAQKKYQTKKYSEALGYLKKVLLVLPDYRDTQKLVQESTIKLESRIKELYQGGLVYEGIGQTVKAEKNWKKILEIMPLENNGYYQKALNKLN